MIKRLCTVAWALTGVACIAFWGGILWRRCNATGAWAGIVVSAILFYLTGPDGLAWELPDQYVLYILGGFAALIIASLLTKAQDETKLDHFYTRLHTPVGEEDKLREAGIDIALE